MRRRGLVVLGSIVLGVPLGLAPLMLAQIDPKAAADGLVGPAALGWIIVGLVIALVFVVRAYMAQNTAHAKALADANAAHAAEVAAMQKEMRETQRSDAKEMRELVRETVPLAGKLTEGLEILERLSKE